MPQVKLYITRNETGQYWVVVDGSEFYNAPVNAGVGVRVKGDDTWFDETLFGMSGAVLHGGSFNVSREVPGSAINEDWGRDEVYALVKVQGYGELKTNTITGYF